MHDQEIILEPWKDEYTFISQGSFILINANLRKEAGLESSKNEKAIEYETPFRIKERNTLRNSFNQ